MISSWARLTLLQRFTVASALIAVGLVVVLSTATIGAVRTFAIKDEAQTASEMVLRTLRPQLRPSDFQGTFPAERRALVDALFRAHVASDAILRIRLWRSDGRLLYSNVPEPEGLATLNADLTTPGGYRSFVAGRRRVEPRGPRTTRIFVPVQMAGSPTTLGAFELFYDLALLEHRLASVNRIIWTAVPTGVSVLYLSVFVLVRRASRRLLKQQADLIAAHVGTFHSLASAIDAKDSYTADHSMRVADIAVALGRAIGLRAEAIEELRIAARLHDLGKIGIPDAILMKPALLSPEEQMIMRRHANAGFEILREAPFSDEVKRTVRYVHERWDGSGYPDGLTGEAIPVWARIVAIVDAYEALRGDRPYRNGVSREEALEHIRAAAGTQFDPAIAGTFVGLMSRVPREAAAERQRAEVLSQAWDATAPGQPAPDPL